MLRGKRFELDDQKAIKLMETIHKSFQIVDMSGGILSQLPWIRFFAPDKTGYRPLVETMKPLWEFLKQNIGEVMNSSESRIESNNFIDLYCREILKDTKKDSFSREQLLALCIDFFQAGSETTSNTLSFAILYMSRNPKVLQKVQQELDSVVGDRFPKMSDRPKLKFTEATLCEIQRISNVAPLGKFSNFNLNNSNKVFQRHCTSCHEWFESGRVHHTERSNRSFQHLQRSHGRDILEESLWFQPWEISNWRRRTYQPREFHSFR